MSLEEYEIVPERFSDVVDGVDVVVVLAIVLPQLVIRINTTTSEAMRRIVYSFGRTRMRPS